MFIKYQILSILNSRKWHDDYQTLQIYLNVWVSPRLFNIKSLAILI